MTTRREVLKKFIYATPAIVTSIAVIPAFTSRGSNQSNRGHGKKKGYGPLPPDEKKK